MSDGNGNGHEQLDLAAILEATRPRAVRLPAEQLRPDMLTAWELVLIGRELGRKPSELTALGTDDWQAVELGYAIAWAILRRVEPELTLDEVHRMSLETRPDPTPAEPAGPGSATSGIGGSSSSTDRPGSRRPRRGR